MIKVIHLVCDRRESLNFVKTKADGSQVVYIEQGLDLPMRFWDIHGDDSSFEDVFVCQEGDWAHKIDVSPFDNSIAIMLSGGVIRLAHRRVWDVTWTVKVVADGKCFDIGNLSFSASGQLLATVRVDGGVEIWDPIKGNCLKTIACGDLWNLEFSPDERLLAAAMSWDHRVFLCNV
jgi:WD40 repeat protein